MATPQQLDLSAEQRAALQQICRHADKPYVRERAAALLKVADGHSMRDVAAHLLLQPRDKDTVRRWVHGYRQRGPLALYVRKGRGRRPASFPTAGEAGGGRGR